MEGIETVTRAPGGEVEGASSLLNELSGMFEDTRVRAPEPVAVEEVPVEEPPPPAAEAAVLPPPPIPSDPIIWKPGRRSFLRLRR